MAALHTVAGYFCIEAVRGQTARTLADWQPNIITDAGMASIGGSGPAGVMAVGDGTGTLSINDSALFHEIAAAADAPAVATGNDHGPPWTRYMRLTWTFAAGAVAGKLTELGIRTAGGTLYTHAAIKNRLGAPIAVAIDADETLVVRYAFVFALPDTADTQATVTVDGRASAATLRYANIDASRDYRFASDAGNLSGDDTGIAIFDPGAVLGTIANSPTGGRTARVATGAPSRSAVTHNNGVFAQHYTYSIGPAQGNDFGAAGIAIIASSNSGTARFVGFQIGLDPPVSKSIRHGLDITLALAWRRGTA